MALKLNVALIGAWVALQTPPPAEALSSTSRAMTTHNASVPTEAPASAPTYEAEVSAGEAAFSPFAQSQSLPRPAQPQPSHPRFQDEDLMVVVIVASCALLCAACFLRLVGFFRRSS